MNTGGDKMKLCKCIVAILVMALLLSGCTDMLFTTAEYRSYHAFANKHKAGMEKQEILDTLGCPDGYVDTQGNYQTIPHAEQDSFVDLLLTDSVTAWVYECWKRPDPADPYRLKITLDQNGKSTSAELTLVPGG